MPPHPSLDLGSPPHAPACEFDLRLREVCEVRSDLDDARRRDPKHLCNLADPYEMVRHARTIPGGVDNA